MIRCYRIGDDWHIQSSQVIRFTGVDPSESYRVAVFDEHMNQIVDYEGPPEPVEFETPVNVGELTVRVRSAGNVMPFETTYDPQPHGSTIHTTLMPDMLY